MSPELLSSLLDASYRFYLKVVMCSQIESYHVFSNEMFCLYVVKPLQNAAIACMVWIVKNCVVTVATGNRVITWTEPVHTDVTLGFTERNVIKVR